MHTHEINERLHHLRSLIEAEAFEECLSQGTELLDRFYGVPSLHYAVAVCLFKTARLTESTMHLEIAASKFKLSSRSNIDELEQLISISGLLVRTGVFAQVVPLIKNNLDQIKWPTGDLSVLRELVNICMTVEAPDTCLEVLESAFNTYDRSELIPEYLLLTATAAHACDNLELEFESYIKALELDPGNVKIHSRISRFLGRQKRWDLASDHIKFVSKIDPSFQTGSIAQDFFNLAKSGSFEEQEALRKRWLSGDFGEQDGRAPFAALIATDDGQFLLLNEAKQFAEWTTLIPNKSRRSQLDINRPNSTEKIRVGYVSADFRNHAVCHLITDLIGQHNRKEFEIFGYSISMLDQSKYRHRIAENFDKFYSLENTTTC